MSTQQARRPQIDYDKAGGAPTCPVCAVQAPVVTSVGPAFKCGACDNLVLIGNGGRCARFVPFGAHGGEGR
jgi:hypothetical protein